MSNSSLPLEKDRIVPAFTLPGADGMPHSPWDYKQREHLILLLTRSTTTDAGRNRLHTFAQDYRAFREEHCSLLAITADAVIVNLRAQEQLNLPFPLLSDPKGTVIAQYTHWDSSTATLTPSIVLANRYGAVFEHWITEDEAELPSITELLESLQYMNRLCTP